MLQSSQRDSLRILQLSDCHLLPNPNAMLQTINPKKNLEAVLAHVMQTHFSPDAIIITGDLVQDGSVAAYEQLAQVVSVMDCPIYYVPGNHDETDVLAKAFTAPNIKADRALLWDHWQIILLDSTAPGLEDGFLGSVDFAHLENCLKKYPDHHTLIILHHPPLAIGVSGFDSIRLINDQAFLDKIHSYSNIKAVLFGHIHQVFESKKNNTKFLSAPSTAIQCTNADFDYTLTPGYRWLELNTQGQLKTGVIYL